MRVEILWAYVFLFLLLYFSPLTQAQSANQSPKGIAALHYLSNTSAYALVADNARPLLTARDQESFLKELEGQAPNWALLHDQPDEEIGERLFTFNRIRDQAREGHPLLDRHIAFLWSGILRQYVPQHRGFRVAIGPEFTKTAWGVVRFKPFGLPDDLIAIPSADLRAALQRQLAERKKVEIKILFSGRLVPDESIMYAFSHDDPNQGMIIPVVQTEKVQFFLPSK